MDIFVEYAHEGDLQNNGEAISGLAELNAALLKAKPEPVPVPRGFGLFVGPLGTPSGQDPLPLYSARQDCLQNQAVEAKQQREDQRVIADAIRSGVLNSPGSHSREVTPQNPIMVSGARVKEIFKHCCLSINRLVDNPTQYSWLAPCYQKKPGSTRNEWCLEKTKEVLKNQNQLTGEPLPFDSIPAASWVKMPAAKIHRCK